MKASRRSTAEWWCRGELGTGSRWDTLRFYLPRGRRGASEVQNAGAPGSIRSVQPADTTEDALFAGALPLFQPTRGYRVNVDALLLVAFASAGRVAKLALDLGAGTGAVGLALHHVGAARRVVLLEREQDLAVLCARNLDLTGATGSVERADLEAALPRSLAQRADLVVANPPYHPAGSGRPRRDPKSRRARSGALEPFVRAAARALAGPSARFCVVYPAHALAELLTTASAAALVPKRLRLVHAAKERPARVALVELRLARPGGLVVEPPLVEWSGPRRRSQALERILAGRFGPRHDRHARPRAR
jgi:tRNA1Val (adenine37-N6)-methyltransferase